MRRRDFLGTGLVAATLSQSGTAAAQSSVLSSPDDRSVWLVGDSAPLDLAKTAALYARLGGDQGAEGAKDSYLKKGAVEQLEKRFTEFLGKEDCAFFATGTLANNVAVRTLCGERRRAVVQYESHLYRDESDAAQILGGINLAPLGQGRAQISVKEIMADIDAAENGPYPVRTGAISIESPVRRADGELVRFDAARAISAYARDRKIGLHLDGARLLLAPPGFDVKAYSSLFDTVYVSLYKYLGAPFGAVLAGPKETIEKTRHLRHLYGGLIYQGWGAALPVLDAMATFPERMLLAHRHAEALFSALEASGRVAMRRVPSGSNVAFAHVGGEIAEGVVERCRREGVAIAEPRDGEIRIGTNTSILRRPIEEYVRLILG